MTRKLCVLLLACAGGLTPAADALSQPDTSQVYFGYPKDLQRVHLKFVSAYVFFRMGRSMDADSAAILAADAERLPYSLYYDGDYADGPEGNIKQLLSEGNSYVFRSGTDKADLDRALQLLEKAKQDAVREGSAYWQHGALAGLGKAYAQRGDAEASKQSFDDAIDVARKANDPVLLRKALVNRGAYTRFGDPQKELDFQESLKLAQQQQDTIAEIDIRTLIYQVYFVQRKFDTVRTQLLHVTELEKLIGYRHLHYNYDVLAFLEGNSALSSVYGYNEAAIASMEATKDFAFSNFFYVSMAGFYIDFDDWDRAMEWINKSFQQEHLNRAKRLWYGQFFSAAENLAKGGRPQLSLDLVLSNTADYPPINVTQRYHVAHVLGLCYHRLNKRDSSEKYFKTMLSVSDSAESLANDDAYIYTGYLDAAKFYLWDRKVQLARRYFEKSKNFGNPDDIFRKASIHRFQYKLDSIDGNYFKALKEYQAAQILWDSIYTVTKNKQLTELRVQYEVASKDKDIELLVEKDKVQQATLERSTLETKFTWAGIGVMLLVTGLIYRQYLSKQRRNKEIQDQNLTLERLVKDKEWLLKEIHHRVKNNLQIIISLLRTQAAHLTEEGALAAIHESQSRMQVISLLHQKLYKEDTDSSIDMRMYIPDLVNCIREGTNSDGTITYAVDVDDVKLNISQAVPVGLILNEAITNAVKYAYPKGQRGTVRVYLKTRSDGGLIVGVSDSGKGLPANFDYRSVSSMGLKLVETLSEQLEGTLDMRSNNGTTIEIAFAGV